MGDYTDQIEKFLRGQMSREEEISFKASLASDECFHSFALIMALVLKAHKKSQ